MDKGHSDSLRSGILLLAVVGIVSLAGGGLGWLIRQQVLVGVEARPLSAVAEPPAPQACGDCR